MEFQSLSTLVQIFGGLQQNSIAALEDDPGVGLKVKKASLLLVQWGT